MPDGYTNLEQLFYSRTPHIQRSRDWVVVGTQKSRIIREAKSNPFLNSLKWIANNIFKCLFDFVHVCDL